MSLCRSVGRSVGRSVEIFITHTSNEARKLKLGVHLYFSPRTMTPTLALNPAHTLPLPPGNGRSLLCTRACYTVYTNFLQFL